MAKKSGITGNFRITHMDEWDQDFVDIEVPGFIRFDADDTGEFHFGCVHGEMTVEQTDRNGKPAVEWTWEGNDEMDEASGRGWAVLQEDGSLKGKLFFHSGDSSGFTALPKSKGATKSGRTVLAKDVKTGKVRKVDIETIKEGKIRHGGLPAGLLRRIRGVHEHVRDILGRTLEQFEIGFMRDMDPEKEVVIWERLVAAMARVEQALPEVDKNVVLRTLLAYSMGALAPAEKANPLVKKIIKVATGK